MVSSTRWYKLKIKDQFFKAKDVTIFIRQEIIASKTKTCTSCKSDPSSAAKESKPKSEEIVRHMEIEYYSSEKIYHSKKRVRN